MFAAVILLARHPVAAVFTVLCLCGRQVCSACNRSPYAGKLVTPFNDETAFEPGTTARHEIRGKKVFFSNTLVHSYSRASQVQVSSRTLPALIDTIWSCIERPCHVLMIYGMSRVTLEANQWL